jgi:type IV pilus assembly protein PilX
MNTRHSSPKDQRGAALVIGLIFLALISLIATVGMRQSITQERMAGGLRQQSLALAGAESAVRAGERDVIDFILEESNGGVRGEGDGAALVELNSDAADLLRDSDPGVWDSGVGGEPVNSAINDFQGLSSETAKLAQQPVFVLEKLGNVREAPGEGGASGDTGYQGSGGLTGGNSEPVLYRITGRATGGVETVVRTVETTYLVVEG